MSHQSYYHCNRCNHATLGFVDEAHRLICNECKQPYTAATPYIPTSTPVLEVASTGAHREKLYPKGAHFPARYDLMMRNDVGMRRLAETWAEGFKKYGRDNWMGGFPQSVYITHALDHIILYLSGDRSEDHLGHCAWNVLALAWVEEKKPELLDLTMPVQDGLQAGQGPKPEGTY